MGTCDADSAETFEKHLDKEPRSSFRRKSVDSNISGGTFYTFPKRFPKFLDFEICKIISVRLFKARIVFENHVKCKFKSTIYILYLPFFYDPETRKLTYSKLKKFWMYLQKQKS